MCTYKRLLYTACNHSYWRDQVAECHLQKEYNAQCAGQKCPIRSPPRTIGAFERAEKCPHCRDRDRRLNELKDQVKGRGQYIQEQVAKSDTDTNVRDAHNERIRNVKAGLEELRGDIGAQAGELRALFADLRVALESTGNIERDLDRDWEERRVPESLDIPDMIDDEQEDSWAALSPVTLSPPALSPVREGAEDTKKGITSTRLTVVDDDMSIDGIKGRNRDYLEAMVSSTRKLGV